MFEFLYDRLITWLLYCPLIIIFQIYHIFFLGVKCVLYFNQALVCALLFASKLWRPLRLTAPHTFTNHCYALKSLTIHLLLRLHIERNRIALQTPQDAFQNSKRLTYQKRKKSKHLELHLASWKRRNRVLAPGPIAPIFLHLINWYVHFSRFKMPFSIFCLMFRGWNFPLLCAFFFFFFPHFVLP